MKNGKKSIAQKIINKALINAASELKELDKNKVLVKAVFNVSPDVDLKSKKIGTSSYLVPGPISQDKRLNIGIKNLIDISLNRKEYTMIARLSNELIDAYNNKGATIKKKDDIHKQAELNKSFTHFNW